MLVDTDQAASKIDINEKWDTVLSEMEQYRASHKIGTDMAIRVQDNFQKEDFFRNITQAMTQTEEINVDQIKFTLLELVSKVTTDQNIAIKIASEKIDAFQLHKSKGMVDEEFIEETPPEPIERELPEREEEKEEKEYVKELSLVILQTDIVLSPVKGIPVSELKDGDEVMVRIIDNRDIALYLNKLLGGGSETERKPIRALIKEIGESQDTGALTFMVEFGPGIFGRAYSQRDLKVETPYSDEIAEIKKMDKFKIQPTIVITVLIIIFVVFVLLTIISK